MYVLKRRNRFYVRKYIKFSFEICVCLHDFLGDTLLSSSYFVIEQVYVCVTDQLYMKLRTSYQEIDFSSNAFTLLQVK